jgi:isopenicillin N synthase-like dioxygenase
VDLSQDAATAARQVYAACSGPGFFYAANHGIPQELLTEVFRQMRAAFDMTDEAKMLMLADENNRGCEPSNQPGSRAMLASRCIAVCTGPYTYTYTVQLTHLAPAAT